MCKRPNNIRDYAFRCSLFEIKDGSYKTTLRDFFYTPQPPAPRLPTEWLEAGRIPALSLDRGHVTPPRGAWKRRRKTSTCGIAVVNVSETQGLSRRNSENSLIINEIDYKTYIRFHANKCPTRLS